MKRVVIIHGWGGSPKDGWYPWLKTELEKIGFEVFIPEMPETDNPVIDRWVGKLEDTVGEIKEGDILIGHSIGCQTILRFLEKIKSEKKADKVILVAGWFSLTNLGVEEEEIANSWLKTPINFQRVKDKANKFVAIFSDDDPYVRYKENAKIFRKSLGAEIILERGMGHFTQEDGVKELPILLNLI